MHDQNIVHRDLKPENVVISNVIIWLSRVSAKFVISVGPLSVLIAGKHTVEL